MMSLIFCLLLKVCRTEDNCEFKGQPSIVKSLIGTAELSRGCLSSFGLKSLNYFPGPSVYENFDDEFGKQYLFGALGFGVPFAIIFILLFIFSCIYCCACCSCCFCCCKSGQKPKLLLIIAHFIGIALFLISDILFLTACVNIVDGAKELANLPNNMDKEFNNIFNTVDEAFNDTFSTINDMVLDIENKLRELSAWLKVEGPSNVKNAESVLPLVQDYEQKFTNGEYKTTKDQLDNYVSSGDPQLGNDFNTKLNAMETSVSPSINAIEELAQKLISSSNDLNEAASNIDKTINGSIQDVKNNVKEFENGELVQQFDEFQMTIDDLINSIDFFGDIIVYIEKYVNPIIIAATAFLLIVGILYGVIFFHRNCCALCCFQSFPIFVIILNIIIILPALIFAAIFLLLYDVCPYVETVISLEGSSDYGNLTNVLICSENQPLFDLLDLDFDYISIINDLANQTSKSLQSFSIPENIQSQLSNYGDNFDVDRDISSNHIIYEHESTLSSLISAAQSASSGANKENIINTATKVQGLIANEENTLTETKSLMKNVINFGSNVVPRLESTQTNTANTVNEFTNEAKYLLSNHINNITCRSVRCVYAPVRNALCSNLFSGISYWIISSIVLICSFGILFITLCFRRRQSSSSYQITNDRSSSSLSLSDDEMKDFQHDKYK